MKFFSFLKISVFCLALGLIATPALTESWAKESASAQTNKLSSYDNLTGTYIALRHGESFPSAEKRVCGSLEAGVDPKNGLTPKGKEEVIQSTKTWIEGNKKLIEKYLKQDKLVIVASPFSRTKDSAELVADVLRDQFKKILPKKYQAPDALRQIIVVEKDLRERSFGKFEGQLKSGEIYEKVWAQDKIDPTHTKWNVESTTAVQERATEVIAKLEEESKKAGGKLYILVAHGDTLKILQTGFQKQSAALHCDPASVPPFKTAEIRELKLNSQKAAAAQ